MSIANPAALSDLLVKHGYTPKVDGQSVFIPMGSTAAPYTASFRFDDKGHLQITCQLAVVGDFPEANLGKLALAALDANTQISPYAFAVIGASQGEVDIHLSPLVLIDTLLTSDLCEEEVIYSVDRLLQAITSSASILKLGLAA
jgi:hypothetical protein